MKNQKGITLVALVITIIVLLILAGVSISLVVGQNGVLGRATDSVAKNKAAQAKEAVQFALMACEADYYSAWSNNQSVSRTDYYTKATVSKNLSSGCTLVDAESTITLGTTESTFAVNVGSDKVKVNAIIDTAGNIAWKDIVVGGKDTFDGETMAKK